MRTLKLYTLAFYLLWPTLLSAQDVEATYQQIKEKLAGPALQMKGSINATLLANYSNLAIRRVDPFAWRLNGQLNFNLYGIHIPLNLLTSSRSTVFNYQLPAYTFVGLSPSYKWAKLHLGNSNLNFSPYIFAGHSFSGIGIELRPGIWRFKAMRGRLQQTDFRELGQLRATERPLARQAWGVQAGIDTGKDKAFLSLLKVVDKSKIEDQDSLPRNPMENLVVGIAGRKQISPIIYLQIDYAMSFLSRNTFSPIRTTSPGHWLALGLMTFRNSTASHKALKTSIGLKTNFGHIEFHHERVDQGYRSLGTLFFNDDIENVTTSSAFSAFQKKVKISAHLGIQRNNLSGFESNSQRRWIGTINTSFMASNALNLNLHYSNFSATNRLRFSNDPLQVLDSIKLVLVNQQLNLSGNYRIDKEGHSSLQAQFSVQRANSIQNDEVQDDQQNRYYLGQLSYLQQMGAQPITLSSSLLVNSYESNQIQHTGITPSVTVVIPFQKNKIKWTNTCSYHYQKAIGFPNSQVFNWQQGLGIKWNKKQRLRMQVSLIIRSNTNSSLPPSFVETRGRLSYGWQF